MLNLMFNLRDGRTHTEYDVHPRSQETPIIIPDGAWSVVLYLGVRDGGTLALANGAADEQV